MFLGVQGFSLEFDRLADELFQLGEMPRLLVEKPIDDLLRCQNQQLLALELARFTQDLAEDFVAGGLCGLQRSAPAATGAGLAEDVLERLVRAF